MSRQLPSIIVMLAACSSRASPPPQAAPPRTEFVLDQLPVRVTFTEPNGLARGDGGCEASYPPWRPELGAAVVGFITSDLLAKGKRVRHVAIGKSADESVGLSMQLAPDEVAITIAPRTLLVYDRKTVSTYCMSVLTSADIWIQLDLIKMRQ